MYFWILKIFIWYNETIFTQDAQLTYAFDESLIANINNYSKWLVGVINTTNRNCFRCNLTSVRNADYLRTFVTTYIEQGNTIISEGWQGYNWLNDANSGFNHLTFIHGQGQWGSGIQSTAHIESVWSFIKNNIKNTYHSIPRKGLYYFLKDAEFRFLMKNKTNNQILIKIKHILKYAMKNLIIIFIALII